MMRVKLTPAARDDLQAIWSFIANDNPTAADRFLRRLSARMEKIPLAPHMGSAKIGIVPACDRSSKGPTSSSTYRRMMRSRFIAFCMARETFLGSLNRAASLSP
jgi:plasmid stabilization system protein ParE